MTELKLWQLEQVISSCVYEWSLNNGVGDHVNLGQILELRDKMLEYFRKYTLLPEADKPADKWRPGDYVYLCKKCGEEGLGAKWSTWCEKCATETDKPGKENTDA